MRVLFVCDYYYNNPTSIGIIVDKIVKEFKKRDIDVYVLSYAPINKRDILKADKSLYFINAKLGDRLRKIGEQNTDRIWGKFALVSGTSLIRLGQLVFWPWARMTSISVPLKYYNKIKEIYREKNIDMIISSHSPFDGMLGSYWFKKKNRDIRWVCYILDSLTNKGKTKFISSKTNDKKGWFWEQKFYKLADKIINIQCNEIHNKQKRYNAFRDKMYIADIPLMEESIIKESIKKKVPTSQNSVSAVYAGRLLSHLSSPKYLCEVFTKLSTRNDIKLEFYSSGDCQSLVDGYNKRTNGKIVYKGIISHEKLLEIYEKTDILVSIGSRRPDMLPSKIFEYMSTGKKIIHVTKGDGDICVEHFNKYPQALILDEREPISESVKKVISFIKQEDKNVSVESLKTIFKINTPEYTADLMLGMEE